MYNSLPRGGTMLVLYIIILQKDKHTLNLHTNIIYIKIYYKCGNPTKKIIPKFPQRNQRKPKATSLRCCIFAS